MITGVGHVTVNGSHMVTTGLCGQARVLITGRAMDITVVVNAKVDGIFGIGVGAPDRLHGDTYAYNRNHDMAWFYDAYYGLVNTDVSSPGSFSHRHGAGRHVVLLMVRGGTLTFSVDGVLMPGEWDIPSPAYLIVSPFWIGGTVDISATLM